MAKKITVFFFALTLFFSLSVSVSMAGSSTSGHNMIDNHNAAVTKNTKHMATHDSNTTQIMDSETALVKMKNYMQIESQGGYELKNFTDDGAYYKADVLSPEGTLLNKLVVNKKNGHVYFAKK